MSMIEKFKEYKKAMYDKFDEAHEECAKKMDNATEEFLNKFESLVANASEDEFKKFVFDNDNELDEADAMAAVAMRLKAKHGSKHINVVVID